MRALKRLLTRLLNVEDLLRDVGYALRVLRKSPAFTVVGLLTLMLGIGANVVVFGVVNAVLLHPLDVKDPGNLYQIRRKPWMSGRLLTTSYPAFEDLRRRNVTFSGMAGIYAYSHAVLRRGNAATNVAGDEVTGNYVVLSDGLWGRAFQSDWGIIGTIVDLNRHPFTVVGVAPAEFHGTERFAWPDYSVPMMNEEQVEGARSPA